MRCVRWDLGRTSELRARRYHADLNEWRNELIEATAYDSRILSRDGMRIAGCFRLGKEVTVSHPNGTDLKLRLAHREPIVDDGVVDESDVRSGHIMWALPWWGHRRVHRLETYAEGTFSVANCPGVMFLQ